MQKRETDEKWNNVERKFDIDKASINEINKKIEDHYHLRDSELRVTRQTLTVLQGCIAKLERELKIIPSLQR